MGLQHPDGELRWLSVNTEPLFAPGATRPHAVVSTFRDISRERAERIEQARHTREQEALRAVATLVAGEAPPDAVFAAAAEHVAAVLGGEFGAIARLEDTGDAQMAGSWAAPGQPRFPVGHLVDQTSSTAVAQTLRTGRAVTLDRYREPPGQPIPVRSGVAAPITVNGSLWGAVSVGWRAEAQAPPGAAAQMDRFADLVSLAVTGAEAREQLARLASTDHLTGLHNHRSFSDRLAEEFTRARRHGRPLSLVVLDIDHFKLVNDTHGHEAGNRTLSEFATRLGALTRGGDVLARVGGEEFAWIVPDAGCEAALLVAERARLTIAQTPFPGVGRVTTSVGVCSLKHARDPRELYRHADLALYCAKAAGRNTTTLYTPETVAGLAGGEHARRLEAATTLAAIHALATAVDAKDPSTQRHSERVADHARALAVTAGWSAERAAQLHDAALVHDVGKIGVPDHILLKPRSLDADEYAQVKTHAVLGAEMLADLLSAEQVGWIRHHHERPDGSGYPDALTADAIPEGAALLAVADAWDAMTVARPYGAPRTHTDALAEMRRGANSQFAPAALDALFALEHTADALLAAAMQSR